MMSLLLISISNSGGAVVAPPVTRVPRVSARYWRVDNLVYESSGTQIKGMYFYGKTGSGRSKIEPTVITTNNGIQTTAFNHSYIDGDAGVITTVDAITFFEFDFTTPVTPEGLAIFFFESDFDYIESCDISYSDDGTTWTQVGIFGRTVGKLLDNADILSVPFWKPAQITIPSSSIGIISGRKSNAIVTTRGEIVVISGRHPAGAAIVTGRTYVITTPV